MTTGTRYPVTTLTEMALIPAEARPRFLAELPQMLDHFNSLATNVDDLARDAKWPWYLAWLPLDVKAAIILKSLRSAVEKAVWIDDDKGTATVQMHARKGGDPMFVNVGNLNA